MHRHAHMHAYAYLCMPMHAHRHAYACMCACISMQKFLHAVCMHTSMHAYNFCMHICMHRHAHWHANFIFRFYDIVLFTLTVSRTLCFRKNQFLFGKCFFKYDKKKNFVFWNVFSKKFDQFFTTRQVLEILKKSFFENKVLV